MAFCCHLLINQRKRQQKLIACPGSIPRAGAAFSAGSWGWKRWLMRMDLPSGLDEDGFTFGVGWGWIYLLGGQSAKYLSAVLTDEHQGCAGREVYYKHSSSSLPDSGLQEAGREKWFLPLKEWVITQWHSLCVLYRGFLQLKESFQL